LRGFFFSFLGGSNCSREARLIFPIHAKNDQFLPKNLVVIFCSPMFLRAVHLLWARVPPMKLN